MRFVAPATSLVGAVSVPGDRSISHRAALLAAVCEGETRISGFGRSADTEATLAALRSLNVEVVDEDVDAVLVRGRGLRGLAAPREAIDCGSAATLVCLLVGILAGQRGGFELTGHALRRSSLLHGLAEPLRRMGATLEHAGAEARLTLEGGALEGTEHELPVASARLKSALLLAGLFARGRTSVTEPLPTRDHTEILLAAAGAAITRPGPRRAVVSAAERLELGPVAVPGDPSSAAPLVVAATLLPGSELYVQGVGLNPTRTRFFDVLARMGARITVFNRRRAGGEAVGDLDVRPARLVATSIEPDEVPLLLDELPLFALVAASARGESVVRGARELHESETDRIETVTTALRALGIRIAASDDGFRVRGVPSRPRGGGVDARGDHRIAMLGAVAGLLSREGVRLQDADAVAVSFPGFFELLESVTQR